MYCMKGEGKKRQHVVQPFSTEVVRSCKGVFLQRLLQKLLAAAKVYVCALHTLPIHPGFFSNYGNN